MVEKGVDHVLVAPEVDPLADALRIHEGRTLERREVRRDRRLRQPATQVDLARADAVLERVRLVREILRGLP